MTKRIKILFIMFQGSGTNLKAWNEYTESKFLDRLKMIGSVYTYQDKILYIIFHYLVEYYLTYNNVIQTSHNYIKNIIQLD